LVLHGVEKLPSVETGVSDTVESEKLRGVAWYDGLIIDVGLDF